jgi:hypothetical protein
MLERPDDYDDNHGDDTDDGDEDGDHGDNDGDNGDDGDDNDVDLARPLHFLVFELSQKPTP